MNFVLAAIADDDAHRHADLDVRDVGIDNVGRDLRTFFESDNGNDVGDPFLEIRVIRLVKNDKGANRSPA